jgi:hypothetical protein
VCLASGSACSSGGTVTSVGVTSSTATQLTVSGSPITGSGSITLGLNLTGTEAKLVTSATAGTATHCANWDSLSGLGDAGNPCVTTNNDYISGVSSGLYIQSGLVTGCSSTCTINFGHTYSSATGLTCMAVGVNGSTNVATGSCSTSGFTTNTSVSSNYWLAVGVF